ncbi:hypothetical protein Pma05_22930 [Plantactinospora mayteni]|uniref:Uncharacterized protein n=1 Tax=Plantactinospora mayteni TaxID=566021 RepID=A0ABQ4EM45_9ACTN|nr:hypothetical protein Pma05_22930 [Plantactinospora mayteni]
MCFYYPQRGSRSTRSAGADAESASRTGAEFRRAVRVATVDARIARQARAGHEDAPPPPPPPPPSPPEQPQRPWIDLPVSRNAGRYDGWNGPTRAHLAHGRAGGLTPAQQHRARHAERV